MRWRWPGRQLNGYDFRANRGWPELPGGLLVPWWGGLREYTRSPCLALSHPTKQGSETSTPFPWMLSPKSRYIHSSRGLGIASIATFLQPWGSLSTHFPKAIYEVSQHRAAQQLHESTTDLPRVDIAGDLAHASTPCTTHMQTTSPLVFNSKRGVRKHRASQLQQSTGLVGQRSSPHFYRTPRLKELPHPPSLSLGFPAGCFLHGHHPPSRQRGPQFPSSLKPHGPASSKEEGKSRITVTATYEGNLVDAQHSPGWSSICLTSRSSTKFDKLEVRSGSWLSTAPRRSMSCLNSRFALPCACLHADSEYAALVIPSIHLILHNA